MQQARYQEDLMTITAQAPIVHITETAAALSVQGTQNSINMTSTAVLWTPTPSLTPTDRPHGHAECHADGRIRYPECRGNTDCQQRDPGRPGKAAATSQ